MNLRYLFIEDFGFDKPVVERSEVTIAGKGIRVEVELAFDVALCEVGVDFDQGRLEAKNDRTLCLRVSECTGETKRECDHSRYLLRRPV